MLRALVRRAAAGDLEAVEQLRFVRSWSAVYLGEAIQGAISGPSDYSLGDVARQLGISRQGAAQLMAGARDPGPRPGSTPTIV